MGASKNKSRNISGKKDEQTIRTLTRYYPLNEETNSFEIALHYEKASDLFEENTDTFERPSRISDSITDRMSEVLDDIPKGYSADISIRVDDYEPCPSFKRFRRLIKTYVTISSPSMRR